MKKYDKILNLILPIITVICILLVWAFGAYLTDNEYLLPSVGKTLKEFFNLSSRSHYWLGLKYSVDHVVNRLLSWLSYSIYGTQIE